MKKKHLAAIFTATVSLSSINLAQAEETVPATTTPALSAAPAATEATTNTAPAAITPTPATTETTTNTAPAAIAPTPAATETTTNTAPVAITPAPAASEVKPIEAHNEAVVDAANTALAADEGKELDMFRFSLRMEKMEFVKKTMNLDAEQEKKFMVLYYQYDTELKKLNDNRLSIIADYAAKFDNITDADADKLAKRVLTFRKQRNALLEKYYGKIAKATSKTIAARFLQVENIIQATTDVKIASTLPLMPKQ